MKLRAGSTVLAPIAWGTTYVTITELLPDGRPLLVATMRVLPAGLVLLVAGAFASRWRPRGAEWWRTGTLALFNFGIFFPLLVVAVYRLPGGVAAAAGGLQPLLVAALSWPVTRRRPRALDLAVGCVAALGVGMVVIRPSAGLDPIGLLAAAGANVSFAAGVVLTKRFPAPSNRLAATGWQLLLGGLILVPLTALVEGAPPSLTGRDVAGFAYLSLVGTALAFVLWFDGIRRLPAAAPPLLGLAAPVTGAVLGWVVLGQDLSPLQLTGFVVTLAAIAYGATLSAQVRLAAPSALHGAAEAGVAEEEPLKHQEDGDRQSDRDQHRRQEHVQLDGVTDDRQPHGERLDLRVGEDDQRPEEVLPGVEHPEDRHHAQDRLRHRQSDGPQHAQRSCTVDPCGLEHLPRQVVHEPLDQQDVEGVGACRQPDRPVRVEQ
jgi:probable blue pigment (indigoidine) exporter